MRKLARDLVPHAPNLGLYVAPDIPTGKLENAIKDYAPDVRIPEVLAMYDGTLFGSGKDGVLLCKERLVFQNSDLDRPQEIRYDDIVRVNARKQFMRGSKVFLDVNRGRATTEVKIDFSARPEAARHVAEFLAEAMLKDVEIGSRAREAAAEAEPTTDRGAVEDALNRLQEAGKLTRGDKYRMLEALGR